MSDALRLGILLELGFTWAMHCVAMKFGRLARKQGAFVVFGGVHATLYPEEAHKLGGAHLRNWELWNPTPSATLRAGCCAPNAQGWAPCFRVSAAQIPRRCAPE
jgi:hypothetical protein